MLQREIFCDARTIVLLHSEAVLALSVEVFWTPGARVVRGRVAKAAGGRRLGPFASVPSGHKLELLDALTGVRRDG